MKDFFLTRISEESSSITTGGDPSVSADALGLIWYFTALIVLLVGFVYLKAINHKSMKMNWWVFLLTYSALCVVGVVFYIWV